MWGVRREQVREGRNEGKCTAAGSGIRKRLIEECVRVSSMRSKEKKRKGKVEFALRRETISGIRDDVQG